MGERRPTEDPETGRRTSSELTAARTALGAVKRALLELEHVEKYGQTRDPLHRQIQDDLIRARNLLVRYERTGRPRKAQEWSP